MKSDNVLKEKRLQVNDDFYNELVNGLQHCKDVDESENSIILNQKQRRYLRKISLPLIVEQAEKRGVLKTIIGNHYDKEKNIKLKMVNNIFDQTMFKLKVLEDEVDEQGEKKHFDVFGYLRTYKSAITLYSGIRIALSAYDYYKKHKTRIEQQRKKVNDYTFTTDDFSREIGTEGMKYKLSLMLDQGVDTFSMPMYELMKKLGESIIKSVQLIYEKINSKFYEWLKGVIATELLEFAALAALTFATGGAVAVGYVGAAATKVGKLEKIKNTIRLFTNAKARAQKVGLMMRNSKTGSKILGSKFAKGTDKVIKRVVDKVPKGVRKTTKWAFEHEGLLKWSYHGVQLGVSAVDIYNVDEKEVREMKSFFRQKLEPQKNKLLKNYGEIIKSIDQTETLAKDSFQRFSDISKKNFMEKFKREDETITSMISESYGREVTFKNFENLQFVKSFQKLSDYFNEFKSFEFDFSVQKIDQNKIEWNNNFLIVMDDAISFLFNDKKVDVGLETVYTKDGENIQRQEKSYREISNYEKYVKAPTQSRNGQKLKNEKFNWEEKRQGLTLYSGGVDIYKRNFEEKLYSGEMTEFDVGRGVKKNYQGTTLSAVNLFFGNLQKSGIKLFENGTQLLETTGVAFVDADSGLVSVGLKKYIKEIFGEREKIVLEKYHSDVDLELEYEGTFVENLQSLLDTLEQKVLNHN